jgi:cell division protein FtsB
VIKIKITYRKFWLPILAALILLPVLGISFLGIYQKQQSLLRQNSGLSQQVASDSGTIANIQAEITRLNNEDLRKTNNQVNKEIADLKSGFKSTVVAYEGMLNLADNGVKTASESAKFSSILNFLAKDDLPSAQKTLIALNADISSERSRLASVSAPAIPANVPAVNNPPASGYQRQKVTVGSDSFLVDIISADLNSTKVIVDTASDGTCTNNCPVLPLASYVSRSGAYAGINGSYFCPDTYPSCVGKTNSFDTLLMNKNKVYFNSDNNVYSSVPVAIFSGNSGRFINASSGWGRDTSVDAVIANRPLLVMDGNNMFGNGGEEKEVIRSNRSFLGATGSTAYIGVVHNATVVESAKVLQAMGIKNAINLDSGGSTALYMGGYKAGPGRNLPNVVLFVKK